MGEHEMNSWGMVTSTTHTVGIPVKPDPFVKLALYC